MKQGHKEKEAHEEEREVKRFCLGLRIELIVGLGLASNLSWFNGKPKPSLKMKWALYPSLNST